MCWPNYLRITAQWYWAVQWRRSWNFVPIALISFTYIITRSVPLWLILMSGDKLPLLICWLAIAVPTFSIPMFHFRIRFNHPISPIRPPPYTSFFPLFILIKAEGRRIGRRSRVPLALHTTIVDESQLCCGIGSGYALLLLRSLLLPLPPHPSSPSYHTSIECISKCDSNQHPVHLTLASCSCEFFNHIKTIAEQKCRRCLSIGSQSFMYDKVTALQSNN